MPSKNEEDKRNQILEALNACLQNKPFDQTSIKEIAKAAGVNHGLLHYYFKNKEDILIHYIDYVINHYKRMFTDWLNRPEMEGHEQKKRISAFFLFMNERITLNKALSKVFIEIWEIAAYNPSVKAKLRQAYREWVDTLAAMLQRLIIDPDVSRRISTAIVAFLEGMALFSIILEPDEAEFQKILAGFQEKIVDML
ncbi:MAG: TetR/AcrR family transcriptional regulator [Desulfobacteraceae bacterium]|nr:MAG: TetR/AcrR family transcriptional regulator [Desulfobacteraceae bacterium]